MKLSTVISTALVVSAALVGLYLSSIVAANLISASFGAGASVWNAFFLVGLALTTRDRLNDLWGRHRVRNMMLLILCGSGISYGASILLASPALPSAVVARIAIASCAAFAVSETLDFITYTLLRDRPWLERSNSSNVVGALIDSTLFTAIAFGWLWPVIIAQVGAKIAGGYCFSLILRHVRTRREATETA